MFWQSPSPPWAPLLEGLRRECAHEHIPQAATLPNVHLQQALPQPPPQPLALPAQHHLHTIVCASSPVHHHLCTRACSPSLVHHLPYTNTCAQLPAHHHLCPILLQVSRAARDRDSYSSSPHLSFVQLKELKNKQRKLQKEQYISSLLVRGV